MGNKTLTKIDILKLIDKEINKNSVLPDDVTVADIIECYGYSYDRAINYFNRLAEHPNLEKVLVNKPSGHWCYVLRARPKDLPQKAKK